MQNSYCVVIKISLVLPPTKIKAFIQIKRKYVQFKVVHNYLSRDHLIKRNSLDFPTI